MRVASTAVSMGGVAAHHDDGHGQEAASGPLLEQRDTVGVRHPDVQQHQIVHIGNARAAGLGRVFCEVHAVPLVVQDLRQKVSNAELIVDHKNVCHE
jgi:hypothetical protein